MAEQALHFTTLAPNIQVKFPTTAAGLEAARGGDRAGRRDQRDGRVHGRPGDRRRRGGRARPAAVRGGGRRHEPVQPGLLADGRPARRLGEGPRRARRHRPRPGRRELGRHRGVQAGLRDLPGARLPDPPARRRLPAPPPLDRARRRRRRADDAPRLAGPVQRQRDRARSHGSTSRSSRRSSTTCCARIPDFERAYEPDGLALDEFAAYGATARTLRGFVPGYHDLQAAVRDIVLPNPDVRAG